MLTLNIYVIITLLVTTYSFFTLYQRENQFFLFSIYLLKSKTYFCICLNFCLMLLILIGKFIIKVLFNEIRVSEMLVSICRYYLLKKLILLKSNLKQVVEKLRMKFLSFFFLILTLRPTMDISKILIIVFYISMLILTYLTFKRSNYV